MKQIADFYGMKLDNRSKSAWGGVHSPTKTSNGYFMNYIMELDSKDVEDFDFIVIEGFANDIQDENYKKSVFENELSNSLKHLNSIKKEEAIVMVVTTPPLPNTKKYKEYIDTQKEVWAAAMRQANNNNAFYCSTSNVNAHYAINTADHPTYQGHSNMAYVVAQCMKEALKKN